MWVTFHPTELTNIEEIDGNGNQKSIGERESYTETFNTSFSRDFLNSLIITSGAIAVQGEYVGTGESTRKILTDFVLDPANIQRDYCLYNDDGGARFYLLRSTQDLRRFDVRVEFEDIYGVIRPLNVLPNEECSIKIEFRPNNKIFNQPQNYSVYGNSNQQVFY